ncbi:hypothetical protein ANN_16626 [Periplaneta americana]|uniref:Uncharacterized protein n=1 Tax=Periplaneta americana TaxID=6978 RepID=A0ABQ8SRP9_PERAM|nr:hypothetical protein ANN_16626 [Periplaneta americana]
MAARRLKPLPTSKGSGRQHSLKCATGTRCRPVCTVVQQGEIESIPASSYGVHHDALLFPRSRSLKQFRMKFRSLKQFQMKSRSLKQFQM